MELVRRGLERAREPRRGFCVSGQRAQRGGGIARHMRHMRHSQWPQGMGDGRTGDGRRGAMTHDALTDAVTQCTFAYQSSHRSIAATLDYWVQLAVITIPVCHNKSDELRLHTCMHACFIRSRYARGVGMSCPCCRFLVVDVSVAACDSRPGRAASAGMQGRSSKKGARWIDGCTMNSRGMRAEE